MIAEITTHQRTEFVDITREVKSFVSLAQIDEGYCLVYVPHTTAGITINEAADPSVQFDLLTYLNTLVPLAGGYTHAEGNSAAHIKASMMGSSVLVPVESGKISLGTWQGIFFCEFDGPRARKVIMRLK